MLKSRQRKTEPQSPGCPWRVTGHKFGEEGHRAMDRRVNNCGLFLNERATKLVACVSLLLILVWLAPLQGVARAGYNDYPGYDADAYKQLVDASSDQTIPVGTRITVENWRKYKNFLAVCMQWLFAGQFNWKMPSGPQFAIEVGPTIPYPAPYQFKLDTEKYSGQVRLVRLPNGGDTVTGYVAGVPFPNPELGGSNPQAGIKVVYDYYYKYLPRIVYTSQAGATIDRYLNLTANADTIVQSRLSHLSEPGMPLIDPDAKGYFRAIYAEVLEPEQSKYTAELISFPDDPARIQEIYVFLPSLRRSLRLSSSARCSPFLGTDFLNDDADGFNGVPSEFSAKLLGVKRLLAGMHEDPIGRTKRDSITYSGLPSWPTPGAGKWELRDVYVVDIRPLPELGNAYCYPSRVAYFDKETFSGIFADDYDRNMKAWKAFRQAQTPVAVNDGHGSVAAADGNFSSQIWDLQNSHASAGRILAPGTVNSAAPKKFMNTMRYSLPGGLQQIMQ